MKDDDVIRCALFDIIEGKESRVFDKIKEDIDCFFEKYSVTDWLTLSQSAMIHEILMLGSKKELIKQLDDYTELQLKRSSEKDKWQKEIDGEKAIKYFYGMIHGLLEKYSLQIYEEMKKKFDLPIDDTYDPIIYPYLIRTFDFIFITQFKILKEGCQDV